MSTNVRQLFETVGSSISGQVTWGQSIDCNSPGVYVVAITANADKMVCYDEAPISNEFIEKWIDYVPRMTLDGVRPTPEALMKRLNSFWLPDETILYIGKAGTSLKKRVNQYYRTELGDCGPHRGGHWLKTLYSQEHLNIYWATSNDEPAHIVESKFLAKFISNILPERMNSLFDPQHPFPFANLEFPKNNRKDHGIKHQVTI